MFSKTNFDGFGINSGAERAIFVGKKSSVSYCFSMEAWCLRHHKLCICSGSMSVKRLSLFLHSSVENIGHDWMVYPSTP